MINNIFIRLATYTGGAILAVIDFIKNDSYYGITIFVLVGLSYILKTKELNDTYRDK